MPITVILIISSLSFYVYYKVRYVRTNINKPMEKKWLSSKSSIALGAFVALFGINRLFLELTPVSITISILFILVGALSIWTGFKAFKYYSPYVSLENEQLQQQTGK